jgi:hypothetical protein
VVLLCEGLLGNDARRQDGDTALVDAHHGYGALCADGDDGVHWVDVTCCTKGMKGELCPPTAALMRLSSPQSCSRAPISGQASAAAALALKSAKDDEIVCNTELLRNDADVGAGQGLVRPILTEL